MREAQNGMANSLEAFAAEHPELQKPADIPFNGPSAADIAAERKARQAEAARLKESITNQLDQGSASHTILYSAIRCIGILTDDNTWTEATTAMLDRVYGDIEQESLFTDNAAIAAGRLKDQQAAYNAKLRRQTEKQLKGYTQISKGLNDVLKALDALDAAADDSESK